MTKTIKELLDEQIEDFKTDFPAMEGYLDTEVREGMIRMLKDSQLEVISQVEALVRRETVEEILELAYDVNMDDRMASPLYAVTGEEIKDYAKTKNITL